MSDLISRSAFADALCATCNKEYPEEPCEPSECLIRKALEKAPAVDAAPWWWCRYCSPESTGF